jgi:hypothetical protein
MGPKKPPKPGEEGRLSLDDLEDYVKDYILENKTDDLVLNQYIHIVRSEERSGETYFFGGLKDRPALWERLIRPWIQEGFQELRKINSLSKPPV